jgi:hypothetical protein
MKSKLAVAILALLAATTVRGQDGVIHVCPASIQVKAASVPEGWTSSTTDQPFRRSSIGFGVINCSYGEVGMLNVKNTDVVVISRPFPNGMNCTINTALSRQFDCLPGQAPTATPTAGPTATRAPTPTIVFFKSSNPKTR